MKDIGSWMNDFLDLIKRITKMKIEIQESLMWNGPSADIRFHTAAVRLTVLR